MAWKTSSIFSMTRGLRLSNLWMASRTNSSTSAAAASLLSLRNSISCEQCSGSVKTATFTSLVHSVGHPVVWCSLQTRRTAHHGDDVGCHVGEAHAARVESAHQQLPVLISVFVFCDIVRLDHLLFQNDHQLRGGEKEKKQQRASGLQHCSSFSGRRYQCRLTSSTLRDETRSSASCKVFFLTSRSGVLRTRRMSITRSWAKKKKRPVKRAEVM